MGNSLLDQLKKSGLVDKNKAQQAKKEQYKSRKQQTKGGPHGAAEEVKRLAREAHAEKVERDRRLNQQRKEETERKAAAAQIRQLIEANRVPGRDGDIAYNFTDGSIIKKLHLSAKIHRHLTSGRLVIVRADQGYELVPAPVADKIKQRDPHAIIPVVGVTPPEPDDDDPYADYKIPDDLMW